MDVRSLSEGSSVATGPWERKVLLSSGGRRPHDARMSAGLPLAMAVRGPAPHNKNPAAAGSCLQLLLQTEAASASLLRCGFLRGRRGFLHRCLGRCGLLDHGAGGRRLRVMRPHIAVTADRPLALACLAVASTHY